MIQKRCNLLWAKTHLKQTEAKWKIALWSDELKFEILFENHGHCMRRREGPSILLSVLRSNSCSSGGALVPLGFHIWQSTINAERHKHVLEKDKLPPRRRLFHGRPCLFQQDNAKLCNASITTAYLHSRRVWEHDRSVCSSDLSPIENIWHSMKHIIWQRPRIVEQLESYIRKEWDNVPLPKISSVLRCLWTACKRRADAAQWWPCPKPFETCCCHQILVSFMKW